MTDKTHFLDSVLSDWNYKEVYVNGKCVYSVASDTETTLNEVRNKLESIGKLCPVTWKQIIITPYENSRGEDDGVIIKFEFEIKFWW